MTTMTRKKKTVRGRCRVCDTSQKVRNDGRIGRHPFAGSYCAGEGRTPKRTAKAPKAKAAKTPAAKNPGQLVTQKTNTYVAIVRDESGSMNSIRNQAKDAINATLKPIKAQDDSYRVSMYRFGDRVVRDYAEVPASKLEDLPYYGDTMGMTALNDAIMKAISDLEDIQLRDPNASFAVIISTDGYQNAGRERNTSNVRNRIRALQNTGMWTFAIACPPGRTDAIAREYGVPQGNVTGWEATARGTIDMGNRTAQAITEYTTQRKLGATSSVSFYEIDVAQKTEAEMLNLLTQEVPKGKVKTMQASKACQIREVVEGRGKTYKAGSCYYLLSKRENLHAEKNLILEHKKTGRFYEGDSVRVALGLPVGGDARIAPLNTGYWNIWVQSTSVNRNVLARQTILFDTRF